MRDFCKIFAAIRALIGPLALEQGWQNWCHFGPKFPENVSKKILEYINEAIAKKNGCNTLSENRKIAPISVLGPKSDLEIVEISPVFNWKNWTEKVRNFGSNEFCIENVVYTWQKTHFFRNTLFISTKNGH